MTVIRVFYDGGEGAQPGGEGTQQGAPQTTLPEGAIYSDGRFRDTLPADLKSHTALAKITNVEHMARSYISAQKMIGKDPDRVVELPGAEDLEGRRAVLERLGLPKDTTGYKLEAPQGAPEFLAPKGPLAEGFTAAAHKLGILPDQAAGVYQWFAGAMSETAKMQASQEDAAHAENTRALQAKYGAAFDQNIAAANFGVDKVGGDELRALLDSKGLGTHPLVIEAFSQIGKMLAEDGIGDTRGGGGGNPFGGALAPDEARAKARDLQAQAMKEPNMAERRRLNTEAQKFYKMATGGK